MFLGQRCDWWLMKRLVVEVVGDFGDGEGRRSAVQRLAFCIVGQAGIRVLCAAEWSL